ncbi:MAG: hypothetical protein ACJ72D_08125 [Marmoricola sp.]
MTENSTQDTTPSSTLTALAPAPEPFDPAWSSATLTSILADTTPAARVRRPRRLAALVVTGAVVVTAGTAAAVGGPGDVVRNAIEDFSRQPNTTANGLGRLDDPELVAKFDTPKGVFALWIATSSTGKICYAMSDATWDGRGTPTKAELSYGCGGEVVSNTDGTTPTELTDVTQLGGFFKDDEGPLLYGVAPYAAATQVRVAGADFTRTLPVRADSHGYGDALPEAAHDAGLQLTFLDAAGAVLGTAKVVAPVG